MKSDFLNRPIVIATTEYPLSQSTDADYAASGVFIDIEYSELRRNDSYDVSFYFLTSANRVKKVRVSSKKDLRLFVGSSKSVDPRMDNLTRRGYKPTQEAPDIGKGTYAPIKRAERVFRTNLDEGWKDVEELNLIEVFKQPVQVDSYTEATHHLYPKTTYNIFRRHLEGKFVRAMVKVNEDMKI